MPRASMSKKVVRRPVVALAKKLAAPVNSKPNAVAKKVVASPRKVPAPAKKARKAHVGNVRELILKALKGGSQTRPVLQKATGASYNGLVMHLSKLKDEGLITSDSSNRMMTLAGMSAGVAPSVAKPTKTAKKTKAAVSTSMALVPIEATVLPRTVGHASAVLSDAIDQLKGRLARAENIDDKMLVLDALASQIGGPVAEVLMGIKSDRLR